MERLIVSDKAEEEVLKSNMLNMTREKRRAIKNFSTEELQRYLVRIYRYGFQDGCDAVYNRIGKEAEENPMAGTVFKSSGKEENVEEIQIDWNDILDLIREVKGIGPKTIAAIDEKLKEVY